MAKVLSLDTARKRRASPARPTQGPAANPAELWIEGRKPGKSQTQAAHALDVAARLMGYAGADSQKGAWRQCPWWRLSYADVKSLRAKLRQEVENGHYVVGHASHILNAVVCVMREVWRLSSEDEPYLTDKAWLLIQDIDKLPGKKLRKPRRTLTGDEFDRLIAACVADDTPRGNRDLAIWSVAKDCGLRACEFTALMLADYDRTGKRLRIPQIKVQVSDQDTWLPLEGAVIDHIEAWLAVRGDASGALFTRLERGGIGVIQTLAEGSVNDIMHRRGLDIGIDDVTCHAARRGCATLIINKTGSGPAASHRLRHTDLGTMRHYWQPTDEDMRSIARRMAEGEGEDAPGG